MAGQLAGRLGMCGRADDNDLTEFGELLLGNWSAPQQFDAAVTEGDDRRLQTVSSWTAIDDERDETIEFFQNVSSRSRADSTKPVRAWSCYGASKGRDDFLEN